MTNLAALTRQPERRDGYVVAAPRVTDNIGDALRNAFRGVQNVPQDMVRLLREIDRISTH